MIRYSFDGGWACRRLGEGEWTAVTLPHDAMISEPRGAFSAGGANIGWFEGHDYEYVKRFDLPDTFADKTVIFEFEGVYHKAEVYINGHKAAYRPNGYVGFFVCADGLISPGRNELRVVARNADQPNSRWYTGSGIYRPVNMYVAGARHIPPNGVRIRTLGIADGGASVEVRVRPSADGAVTAAIMKNGGTVCSAQCDTEDGEARFIFDVPNAVLWSPDSPELYTCRVSFCGDVHEERFGIRTLALSAADGLRINGARVVLRGACIHHDNGILGARCYAEAEERKITVLKTCGYNAVRSTHGPCSKALLDACDRLGMLVIDEYADMWYIHKTKYDYADSLCDMYERDLTDIIEKDINRPSVIMYSLGNEVAESGQKRGIELFAAMREVIDRLDGTRPVTAGINTFFNYLHSLGLGVYSDKKSNRAAGKSKKTGSEFFNALAGRLGAAFMKTMAKLPGCDRRSRGCFALMDAAGYNYGIKRYRRDMKKYPDRVILGTETFCSDAYEFAELAAKHNAIIGDFVWSGIDYLGEAGVGSREYREYAPDFSFGPGWISAGSGRVDLIGTPLGEALYTKVAFGLERGPYIAVVPVSHTGEKHSPSAWKFTDAMPSWSWNGLDGRKAVVEVYARAAAVELYVNGARVGRKKRGKNCVFKFKTTYRAGTVEAVAYDDFGAETGRNALTTAGGDTVISVTPEKDNIKRGDIAFFDIAYTDAAGTVKPLEHRNIEISVEGGELLAFGNACPYNADGYCGTRTFTYYGRALAVVRVEADTVCVKVTDGERTGEVILLACASSDIRPAGE